MKARLLNTLLTLSLLGLAGCNGNATDKPTPTPETNGAGNSNTASNSSAEDTSSRKFENAIQRNLPDANAFVVDRLIEAGVDQGPLEHYLVAIDLFIDHDNTTKKPSFAYGETVIFNIPDGRGDTGKAYEHTLIRFGDMIADGTMPESANMVETIAPGCLALVRLETPAYPSGARKGDPVPVRIIPVGNAIDIVGGKMYPTSLVARRGTTTEVIADTDYGSIQAEDIADVRYYFEARTYEATDEQVTAKEPFNPDNLRRVVGLGNYLLPERFKAKKDLGFRDADRSELVLRMVETIKFITNNEIREQLLPAEDSIVEGVIEAISARFPTCRVERGQRGNENVLTVVPGFTPPLKAGEVRKRYDFNGDMERLYDEIRVLGFKRRPRDQLHIIADDQNGRLLVVGPERLKKLADQLEFGQRSADSPREYRPSGAFRLVATPNADRSKLTVGWTRLNDKQAVQDRGEVVIDNNIAEVLRTAYRNGCSPLDCLNIVIQANHRHVISARLKENPMRFSADDADQPAAATGGSAPAR